MSLLKASWRHQINFGFIDYVCMSDRTSSQWPATLRLAWGMGVLHIYMSQCNTAPAFDDLRWRIGIHLSCHSPVCCTDLLDTFLPDKPLISTRIPSTLCCHKYVASTAVLGNFAEERRVITRCFLSPTLVGSQVTARLRLTALPTISLAPLIFASIKEMWDPA